MSLIEKEIGTDIDVQGFRILLKAVVIPEKSKGGILYSNEQRRSAPRAYNVGLVLKMGSSAYQPLAKFPKPYCKVGDWVHFSAYEKQEEMINGHLCFFINDERVYTRIPDITKVVVELR